MISRRHFTQLFGAACCGLVRAPSVRAAESGGEWLSWRGNTRDGVFRGRKFPADLSGMSRQWTESLSDSYSGPIIAAEAVFTTETIDKREESLVAFDRETGAQKWKSQWTGAMSVPFFAKANGDWIRSTPATNGRQVLVGGMRDVIACFDAVSGEEQWRIDFNKLGAPLPSFGLVCSPLIHGDYAYVQAGGAIRKIGLSDGSLVWDSMKDEGGMNGGAFSSPIICALHGVEQLISQTRTTLCALELTTGKPLWQREISAFRGMNILTPTVWKDQVFTSAYGGQAQMFRIVPGKTWSTEVVWEAKAEAYMSSPLIVDDHIYMHLRNQRLACLDLATGVEKWRTTPYGKYWSMVTDGEAILALDETGEMFLIRANPERFQLLDRKQVSSEPSWAHVAVAGDQVFVRRQRGLDAFQWS